MPSSCVRQCVCVTHTHGRTQVCVCVCLSHSGILSKRLIPPHNSPVTLVFWHQSSQRNSTGSPSMGSTNADWVEIRHFLRKKRYNSRTVQDRCIVSIKVENRKSYVLYLCFWWPWVTPNPLNHAFHIFIMSKHRDFIFGVQVDVPSRGTTNRPKKGRGYVTWHVFTARGYAKHGICRRRVSVCLCVCHTPVLYQNG